MKDTSEMLQQIAIDVAVIKNEMAALHSLQKEVVEHGQDLAKINTQLSVVKIISGVLLSGVVGLFIRLFNMKMG